MNGSEGLTSFTNRFFHLNGPPGFMVAFSAQKGLEDLAAFGVREVKRAAAAAEERDKYFFAEGQ